MASPEVINELVSLMRDTKMETGCEVRGLTNKPHQGNSLVNGGVTRVTLPPWVITQAVPALSRPAALMTGRLTVGNSHKGVSFPSTNHLSRLGNEVVAGK